MNSESGTVLLDVRPLIKHPKQPVARASGDGGRAGRHGFVLLEGESLALVGESADGNATAASAILRAVDSTAGKIVFCRRGNAMDVAAVESDGGASTLQQLADLMDATWRRGEHATGAARAGDGVANLGGDVGAVGSLARLSARQTGRGPRSLTWRPGLVVRVEPVGPRDASSQRRALGLLRAMQRRFGLSYLFIAADVDVIRHVSDRVAVMHMGRIVEVASTAELCRDPRHPYTQALLAARIAAAPPPADELTAAASGCSFRTRCPFATDICAVEAPPLRVVGKAAGSRLAACHFAATLDPGVTIEPVPDRAAMTAASR